MDRAVSESQLTAERGGRVRFELATERDDAEIRRLLRENPMRGQISIALEREPNFFADAHLPGETKQTIVAREEGRVVCVGSCTTRLRFLNGEPRRVGYLGGLRLDERVAGRFDIMRGGYEFFHELQRDNPAELCFTSIAADNERARRFLERGVPGMPRYDFVGEFVTMLLPVSLRRGATFRCRDVFPGSATPDELCAFLNEHSRQYQLAPCWSADELSALSALGLSRNDFYVLRKSRGIAACAALWDQRSFKQTVIQGYSGSWSRLRPAINFAVRLAGRPPLPEPGATLSHAFISHLGVSDEPGVLLALISALFDTARRRGIQWLTLGFAANDLRLAAVRARFPGRAYRSRIYLVHWPVPNAESPVRALQGCLAPEAALL